MNYQLFGTIPTLSATSIAIMGSGQHLDGSKAKRELGFEAKTKIEDGLKILKNAGLNNWRFVPILVC